jgi:hypothetical protein
VAILVDDCIWPWRDRLWCHMVSDTSLDELHAFARWIGIPERAFGGDHYDITDEIRGIAVQEGAIEVSSRQVVLALHAAGLRRRPTSFGGHHQP